MTVKLTKKAVDNLSLPEKGQALIWDSKLSGFGLRLTQTRKTYIVQGRVNGKSRRTTIGAHGIITAERAREKAIRILGEMNEGRDPAEEKRRTEAAQVTLKQAADIYIDQKRTKKGHLLKQNTKNDIARHVRTNLADWQDIPLSDITPEMVDRKYQKILKRSEAQAVQALRIFCAIYNWQRNKSKDRNGAPTMPGNPCAIITDNESWAHVPPRDRMIPLHKVGTVWNYLETLRADPGQTPVSRTMVSAVMFAFLTGGRWGEVAPLTWQQIDLEQGTWTQPDPKNRAKITFPLSSKAAELLRGQIGKDSVYCFPGQGKNGYIHRPTRLMKKLNSECGVQISPHDLRRTFSAIAEDCNTQFWKQKVLLGHVISIDVTLHNYTQTNDLTRLSPEVEKIANWIERKGFEAQHKIRDIREGAV